MKNDEKSNIKNGISEIEELHAKMLVEIESISKHRDKLRSLHDEIYEHIKWLDDAEEDLCDSAEALRTAIDILSEKV